MRSLYGGSILHEHSFAFIFKLITLLITIYTVQLMYGNKRINRKPHKHGKNRDLGCVFQAYQIAYAVSLG